MHKNKFIFGDASAIRKYGVQEFEDNYFWPVSDSDFDKFSRYMHNTYVELISDIKDDNLYDIALVELSFVHQLIQIFHYNYIKEYEKEKRISFGWASDMISEIKSTGKMDKFLAEHEDEFLD